MIARSAERRIWRPKLAETFFAPNASAWTLRASPAWSWRLSSVVSVSVRTWKFWYRPSVDAPRPWICAFPCPSFAASARTCSSATGCAVLNVICVPPSKSIPRFSPRMPSARIEMAITAPEMREPEVPAPDVVGLQPLRDAAAGGADEARAVEHLEVREHHEERTRREHGGEHRDRRTDQEHQREAADARGGDREEHERGDHRDDVRVDDRAKPFV